MAGYRELREGSEFTEGVNSADGVRIFIDDTTGSDTLPSLGDSFSLGFPNCTLQTITEVLYHFEGTNCKKKYTCNYSTLDLGSEYNRVEKTDSDQFVASGGSEMISIEKPKEWWWVPEPWAGDAVEGLYKGRLFKNTIRGSMSKTVILSTSGSHSLNNFITEQVYPKVGKICAEDLSASDWKVDYNRGTVLFSNYDYRLVKDSDGTKQWEITLNFAYRILQVPEAAGFMGTDAAGNNIQYSWNFYLFPDKKDSSGYGEWQMVTKNGSPGGGAPDFDNDFIYTTAEFMTASANFDNILGEF